MNVQEIISNYNVIWDTPSKDSSGSMPLGNGDTGINLWIEENGDLLLYLAKADAYDNNRRLIKIGRIRVCVSPNPFVSQNHFKQTLDLFNGEISIVSEDIAITVWVDANRNVVNMEVKSNKDVSVDVRLELWREEGRPIVGQEAFCLTDNAVEYADTVVERNDGIMWYYRNPKPVGNDPHSSVDFKTENYLTNRTSGAFIKTKQDNKYECIIQIFTHVAQTETADEWIKSVGSMSLEQYTLSDAYKKHKKWWADFWNRSYIHITGNDDAFTVSQGYNLQRFLYACSGRSKSPVHFNGAIFNVDVYEADCFDEDMTRFIYTAGEVGLNADYRRWGGLLWWQNTRLIYWPMIAAGDFEMLMPYFDIHTKVLPDAKRALKDSMGYEDAVVFFELATMDGAIYKTFIEDASDANEVSHIYYQIIELALMMIDYCQYSGDMDYLKNEAIPMADAGLRFYDQHFKRDEQNKLRLFPVNACETYWKTTNPTNEIAGIKYIIDRMLALPEEYYTHGQKVRWEKLLNELPEIPLIRTDGGSPYLAPAGEYGETRNYENPELYAVFPFRVYGIGKPDLNIAETTFENRLFTDTGCWRQGAIHAAYVDVIIHAGKYIAEIFSRKNPSSRFPAFWRAGSDWNPDLDNGGVGMIALQSMLIQSEGDNILLLPAWPENWDVDFKLNAPYQTTVEGSYKNGKFDYLKVTPEHREKDIVFDH